MEQFSTDKVFLRNNPPAKWLYDPVLQKLLAALSADGEEARVVGGIVRDTVLRQMRSSEFCGGNAQKTGSPHGETGGKNALSGNLDIDIATTLLPKDAARLLRRKGFRIVPLGEEFGTILALDKSGRKFQVTTLRADIKTDGRHAEVRFCRDWQQDALRRDFTVNALYVDRKGRLYDYVGGVADIKNGVLRFIGDPRARIKEDYLRILRFFRFYALFVKTRPDKEAIKAVAALKSGLEQISKERIWDELKKLLAMENPLQSILWLRVSGVLSVILPENEKWGADSIAGLLQIENAADLKRIEPKRDALLRLMALIPPQKERVESLAKRLRLSAKEKRRLINWVNFMPHIAELDEAELRRQIYLALRRQVKQGGDFANAEPQAILDSLRIACASAHIYGKKEQERFYAHLLHLAENRRETMPEIAPFPLTGGDIAAMGLQGAALGKTLKKLEEEWIKSGFTLDKQALLSMVKEE